MYLYCSQQAQSSCRVQDKYCWCCAKAGTHYHSIHTAGQKRFFCVCCLVSWCQSRSCNTPYIWYPIWELIHVASLNMSWDINISLHPIDSFWVSGIIYDDRMRESALALWCKPVLCSTMLFKQNLYICICISYTAPCVVHALCMVDLVPLQCALKSASFLGHRSVAESSHPASPSSVTVPSSDTQNSNPIHMTHLASLLSQICLYKCCQKFPLISTFTSVLSEFSAGQDVQGKAGTYLLWYAGGSLYLCCTGNDRGKQWVCYCDVPFPMQLSSSVPRGQAVWNHQEVLWQSIPVLWQSIRVLWQSIPVLWQSIPVLWQSIPVLWQDPGF